MKLDIITKQVVNLARGVGLFIEREVSKIKADDVKLKGRHNFVTYVDKTAEETIINELKKILPEAGFIAEENQNLNKSDRFNWVIDPLDGTTNFIHSVPVYSISIALSDKDEIIAGVVYEINLGEAFYAWKNGGAFLNGKKINVSVIDDIDNSLIATGFPYYDYSRLDKYLDLFKDLMQNSSGIRRLGSAAVDLAYVACGRFELFYEYGLNPWDVAAGTLIVKEAGGTVTDFKNGNDYISGREIVASNSYTHDKFIEKLEKYFNT